MDTPALSVVLPALNEEATIGECIRKIRRVFADLGVDGEIIIADSSDDRTAAIARDLGATVVRPKEKGYGNAYLAGLACARGRYIVIGDADNTYDFLEIPRLLAPLDAGADMVLGSRIRGEIRPGAMPALHRYIGNPLLTRLLNRVFSTRISDAHTGFRAFRREAFDRLNLKTGGMEFASEMIIEAAKANLRIEEVPITYSARVTPSKLESFSDGWRHVRFMLLYRPIPFVIVPGLIFAIFGFVLMVLFLFRGDVETSFIHSFILAALFFLGGFQALFAGVNIAVYSAVQGYGEVGPFISRLMNYHSLEWELLAGILLMAAGGLVGFGIVREWAASGFGSLFQVANAVWALALFLAGMQVVFSGIFTSMVLLKHGDEQG
ncbi:MULTISPECIES: glycosyltransferase family 2 protein [unclassified Methanoculleus]|jgi:glycosyltransferase involved in cell wall biosynthesis|uniref:Glycosyltransferase family 2 protein n=1 Tax=Methanoculleus palmolei TaxID=72612 RepID=A0ABD8ABW1_9EURY|nr:glycosyltransferase family 2 protein [Methanoculleus sp. UBA377]WOX56668.1 glycosyltransferase family 2 protein [Methanoculleus palmolei]